MPTNPKDYTNLRTMLDSLEVGALRYFLSGEGLSQPQKLQRLNGMLKPLIDELWHPHQGTKRPALDEGECPPGYFDCDGCCVPYKCPDIISNPKPKPRAKSAKRKR